MRASLKVFYSHSLHTLSFEGKAGIDLRGWRCSDRIRDQLLVIPRRAWQEIVGRHSIKIIIPRLRICGVANDNLGEFPTRNRVEVCSKRAGLAQEMVLTPRSKTPKKPVEQGASRI